MTGRQFMKRFRKLTRAEQTETLRKMKIEQKLKLEPWTVLQREAFDHTVERAEQWMEDSTEPEF